MPRVQNDRGAHRVRIALASAATAALIVASFAMPSGKAAAAGSDAVAVTVSGADIAAAAQNRNGLTFKGFGVLSANSTSALLLDYKSQHPDKYWELIETLFGGDHPIMNTVKIEMGNDRNTSTGPNAATMRSRDEYPNVQREPGFQLAADAQTVASGKVHVSLLRWSRPTWVTSDADQYIWFKDTVLAAYREYGIMVDSINPDTNETTAPSAALYKSFSGWLRTDTKGYEGAIARPTRTTASDRLRRRKLYRSIKTIAADTVGTPPVTLGNAMTSATDSSLRDAVDVVGFHYSSADDGAGNLKKIADQLDKEVWNSEGQSTFSNSADRPNNTASDEQGGTGTEFGGTNSALEMGNWITTGLHGIPSHPEHLPARDRLVLRRLPVLLEGARERPRPVVRVDLLRRRPGRARAVHPVRDPRVGELRQHRRHLAGDPARPRRASSARATRRAAPEPGGASYTTLAAPDASDFSTVIVNDSKFTKTYRISTNGLNLGADQTMELWETRAADAGEAYDANYVRPIDEISPAADGSYTFTVKPLVDAHRHDPRPRDRGRPGACSRRRPATAAPCRPRRSTPLPMVAATSSTRTRPATPTA